MVAPTIVFVFLFFSAAVTIGIINASITLPFDRSAVCSKASRFPLYYPPIKVVCCNTETACSKFIPPNATKYGLTNPDEQWQRRLCSCEYKFFSCVMSDISYDWKPSFFARLFEEQCFFQSGVTVKGRIRQPTYEWTSLPMAVRFFSGNDDFGVA